MDQYLRDLYYNSDVSYSGISTLWKKIKEDDKKIKYSELKQWLQEQETYTLHKKIVKKFKYRKTIVSGIDSQWQSDIVEMQKYVSYNDGYRYILTVIDILSRYGWAIPLYSKRGDEMAQTFKKIFKDRKPEKIQFDQGKEFYNKDVKQLFEKQNIEWFSTTTNKKAAIVEKFNLTIKNRMYRYFTEKQTKKWIDIIDNLVEGYNNTYHSSIHMKPIEVNEKNEGVVWYNLYGAYLASEYGKPKFNLDDTVRISKYKNIFAKGYLSNYTRELFKIKQIIYGPVIVYKLQDLNNEEMEGTFYTEELSPYTDKSKEYKVEKILKKKTIKGKQFGLVKWQSYSDKFNSWEPMENIKKL